MNEKYNHTIAEHYGAFRPPLHRLILDRVIPSNESFRTGLDVGCGTGYSAISLAKHCQHVVGLDFSRAMLGAAQRHPKVTYVHGTGDALDQLPVQLFDIVTFAGSLFYTKSERLRKELNRVCIDGGTVIVYDFEVLLNDIMTKVGVDCLPAGSDYDHSANFSGWDEFITDKSGTDQILLDLSEIQTAHLLLADSNRNGALMKRYPDGDPIECLVNCLEGLSGDIPLYANIYFTRYQVGKD